MLQYWWFWRDGGSDDFFSIIMWRLISFSQVNLPLGPYLSAYTLGMVENQKGERRLVQVEKREGERLSVGLKGCLGKGWGPAGEINIFFPGPAAKALARPLGPKRAVKTVGIVGTGTMGKQLAALMAQFGLKVIWKSRRKKSLQEALMLIEQRLAKNIQPTIGFGPMSKADLVIEAIVEEKKAKKALLKKLARVCPSDTILATSSSSFSIKALARGTRWPERFIGLHFFNPVAKMSLVEIIPAEKTSLETVQSTRSFIQNIGKKPLVFKDQPGFVVNRLLFAMINEAGYLLEEKVGSAQEIDQAMKLGAHHPLGPFALIDLIGIDVVLKILNQLHASLPGFRPPAKIFKTMVKKKKLGRKTKEGFYQYG